MFVILIWADLVVYRLESEHVAWVEGVATLGDKVDWYHLITILNDLLHGLEVLIIFEVITLHSLHLLVEVVFLGEIVSVLKAV